MKMKKHTKALLAVLLVMTVVVSMVAQPGFSVQASNSDYKEMKFGDWGTEVGTSGGVNVRSLTQPGKITDLDGVAISGTVNLNGLSWGDSFITIGGTDDKQEGGVQLVSTGGQWTFRYSGANAESGWTNTEATQVNENVELRVTFDKANSNDWTVNVYVGGTLAGSATYTAAPLGLYIGFAAGVTVDMTASPSSYTEMQFSDWGTEEGTSNGVNVYSLTDTDAIKSLDGVSISGTVNLNGLSWADSFITIGGKADKKEGGVQFVSTGGQWWFRYSGTTETEWTTTDATQVNEDVELKITFNRANSNNWTVNVYIGGTLAGTVTYNGAPLGLYIGFAPGVTLSKTPPATTNTEMQFSDWGTEEGTSNGVNVYSLTDTDTITDLDGVTISGTVNLNGLSWADSFITIGGTADKKEGGVQFVSTGGQWQFRYSGETSETGWTTTEATQVNEDVELKVIFDKEGNDNWTVTVYIGGTLAGTTTYNGAPLGLYIGFAPGVTQGSTTPPAITYTEMQFSDWGTSAGTSEGYNIFSLTDSSAITSLDGVAISGKANFNGQAYKWLTIGGTEEAKHGGFWLGAVQANGWAMACQGIGADAGDSIQWSEAAKFDREVELRLTFDKATDSNAWTIGVYADDVLVGTWTYDGATPGLYIGLDASLTVEGLEVKKPVVPTFPNTYTELKFSDFGIYAGVMEGMDIYTLKGRSEITSLNGVAISGKVNYNDVLNGKISIGGTDALKHAGFWLFNDGENLRLTPQGIGNVTIDHWVLWKELWAPMRNVDIDLRMTFNKKADTGEWWVGIHINNEKIGVFNCGVVTPGLYLGVTPSVTVEGLGDAVKNGGIDFTLFGYSNNNWRKEMGLQ